MMVDPLDFLDNKLLLRFLHLNKTELSCMENPQAFVSQLRDYDLISKEQHRKINRMKSKEGIRSAVYSVLDSIETEQSQQIKLFWMCVFKETILNKYPALRLLRNSLMDGSFESENALLEKVNREEKDDPKGKEMSEDEGKKGKRRKKTTSTAPDDNNDDDDDDDDENPGPSTRATPRSRKRPRKLSFSSPLKKGEKGEIWTWALYKVQLPVSCGERSGTLNRDRLAKGQKCITVNKRWYSPSEFERLAGKGAYKNWKLSIRCMDTPLGKLIQEGHLKCVGYKKVPVTKKSQFPSEDSSTASLLDSEDEDSDASSRDAPSDSSSDKQQDCDDGSQLQAQVKNKENRVLRVVCEAMSGLLHTRRFASGTCGRSIRTETRWMTPVDFMLEASCQTDISWKKEIKCEGRPLGELIKDKTLGVHSLLCRCNCCIPDSEDLENEKNDDECWICGKNKDKDKYLVLCDWCPCSFHQNCHLPHVEDALLNDGRQWMCTLCVFRENLDLYPELERDAVMASSISSYTQHCQYLLLHLYRADRDCVFTADPTQYLSDYTSVIRTPMWLDRVADKLQEKSYQTVGEFVSDVQLIFTNCASYNRDNPKFYAIGIKMEEIFKRELKTVLKINEVAS